MKILRFPLPPVLFQLTLSILLALPLLAQSLAAQPPGAQSPGAQTTWRNANGPFGGLVGSMVVDRAGVRWAAVRSRGMFRQVSTSPSRWVEVRGGEAIADPYLLAVDSSAGAGRIYVVSGEEIYRLTAGGDAWEKAPSGGNGPFSALATGADGSVYAGYLTIPMKRLRPGADVWTPVDSAVPLRVNAICATPDGALYLGDNTCAYRLHPDGSGVDTLAAGADLAMVTQILHHPSKGIYARTDPAGIFHLDASEAWTAVGSAMTDSLRSVGNIGAMAIDRAGTLYFHWASVREFDLAHFYRLRDGDTTWALADTTLPAIGLMSFTIDRDLLLAGGGAGVFGRRIDEPAWSDLGEGIDALTINALLALPDGRVLCASGGGGVLLRETSGSWRRLIAGLHEGWVLALAADSAGNFYASTLTALFRMRAGDSVWQRFTDGMAMPYDIRAIAVGDSGRLYAPDITRRDPGDSLWREMAREVPPFSSEGGSVRSFTRTSDGRMYAGTDFGNIHQLAPGDTMWRIPAFMQPRTQQGGSIEALIVDRAGRLYAGTGTGAFYLDSGATSWELMERGLTSEDATTGRATLALDANGNLYSTVGDLIRWDRAAASWSYLHVLDLLPPNDVAMNVAVDATGRVLVGTLFHSVLEATEPIPSAVGTSWVDAAGEVRMELMPSPARETVTARFQIRERGHVLLRLVDMLGREVARRIDEPREAGTYAATLDVRGLTPGSYAVELRTGEMRTTRRIIVLR